VRKDGQTFAQGFVQLSWQEHRCGRIVTNG
jgi:hypothetical protein